MGEWFMDKRVAEKIEDIERYLDELESWIPDSFENYKRDLKTKSACERHFEKIAEATVDLTFLIINTKGLKIPEDEDSSFFILAGNNIISKELAGKLKDAKGMRNFIAYEYGKIDDGLVFNSLSNELIADVREFVKSVKNIL